MVGMVSGAINLVIWMLHPVSLPGTPLYSRRTVTCIDSQ
jgi:hypothetical protein